jgi:hypothetical protein
LVTESINPKVVLALEVVTQLKMAVVAWAGVIVIPARSRVVVSSAFFMVFFLALSRS